VIRGATALLPVLFVIASAWAARRYPLGVLRHQEILEELERRKVAAVVPAAGG
jgi:Na+/melibiose symporter-like transporter